jgi:hypothetical protein
MPKFLRDTVYDLNNAFVDEGGNRYTQRAATSLVSWLSMRNRYENNPYATKGPTDQARDLLHRRSQKGNWFYTADSQIQIQEEYIGDTNLYWTAKFQDDTDPSSFPPWPHDASLHGGGDGGANSRGLKFSYLDDDVISTTPKNDCPWSMSMWIKLDGVSGNQYLFGKGGATDSHESHITGLAYNAKLQLKLWAANNSYVSAVTAADQLSAGVWHHIVWTRAREERTGAQTWLDKIKLYVDGESVAFAAHISTSYLGLSPDLSKLYVGADKDGDNQMDGLMAEWAVWSNYVLLSSEVTAIYNRTRQNPVISGYLNNPPRTLLHAEDNVTGSYPAIARTGDPNFLGTGLVTFDDTKTIEYFSSYAEGELKFSGIPLDADVITLTGSGDPYLTQTFQLVSGAVSGGVDLSGGGGNELSNWTTGSHGSGSLGDWEVSPFMKVSTDNTTLRNVLVFTSGTSTAGDDIPRPYSRRINSSVSFGKYSSPGSATYSIKLVAGAYSGLNDEVLDSPESDENLVLQISYTGSGSAATWSDIATVWEDGDTEGSYVTKTGAFNYSGSFWVRLAQAAATSPGDGEFAVERINFNVGGAQIKQFEFQRGVYRKYPGSALVNIKGKEQTARKVAHALAQSINSSSIGIAASPVGKRVKLRQHKPMVGSFKEGNRIQTIARKSSKRSGMPVEIKQFKQHGEENYSYPFLLPLTSSYFASRVATPNTKPNFFGPARMTVGVSDAGIPRPPTSIIGEDRTYRGFPNEKMGPFIENRVPMNNDLAFYATGTAPTVLPGFSQRLSSKVSISIEINPRASTDIFWSTGSTTITDGSKYATRELGLDAGINSGLAYFCFDQLTPSGTNATRSWEIIGDTTTGSNVDYYANDPRVVANSYLSVFPGNAYGVNPGLNIDTSTAKGTGLPMASCGFPIASKFDATGSQLLDMSKYITAPFLLEKFVLEVSGAFGLQPAFMYQPGIYGNKKFWQPTGSRGPIPEALVAGGTHPFAASGYSPPNVPHLTFMLLNQYDTPLRYIANSTLPFNDPANSSFTEHATHWDVTRTKDVIGYARVSSYLTFRETGIPYPGWWPGTGKVGKPSADPPGLGFRDIEDLIQQNPEVAASSDLLLPNNAPGDHEIENLPWVFPNYNAGNYTGSIRIEKALTSVPTCPQSYVPFGTRQQAFAGADHPGCLFGNTFGGRNLFGLSDGRAYIGGAAGAGITGKHLSSDFITPAASFFEEDIIRDVYTFEEKVSPYLILPTDKLILAAALQTMPTGTSGGNADKGAEENYSKMVVTLNPGSNNKLTLYGSLLRNNKPAPFMLNQVLTSDAIHEDVQDNSSPYGEARCFDQFDVDPRDTYRGSYLDSVITGSMFNKKNPGLYANPLATNVREIQGSVVDGGAGTTGSLERFVRLTNNNNIFYDSTLPKFRDLIPVFKIGAYAGKNASIYNGDGGAIVLWRDGSAANKSTNEARQPGGSPGTDKWMYSFPFQPEASSIQREQRLSKVFQAPHRSGSEETPYLDSHFTRVYWGAPVNAWATSPGQPHDISTDASVLAKVIYGFGDNFGAPLTDPPHKTLDADKMLVNLRGYRYGLYNVLPTAQTAVYRHNTFGQFRDMLEPMPQSRFFKNRKLGPPVVEIVFVSRAGDRGVDPTTTNSQNLSIFATASIPYFDGNTSDRSTIEPDLEGKVTLELILL